MITYDEVFTYQHLYECGKECLKGVLWKSSVQTYRLGMLNQCSILYNQLMNRNYKSDGFKRFTINERGKTRLIQSVTIAERTVQKTLCKYALKPLLTPSLIYDNGASLEGKGTDFAIRRFKKHLTWHYRRYGLQGGILICDFHDYFHSIDHNILLEMLRKKIKDDDIYNLTKYFIECFKDGGLGLGSEISQICAIYYPNKMDHTIKEEYHIHGYARYMDDFYVISEDIEKLKEVYEYIKEVSKELHLTLNEKHTKIYRFDKHPTFTFLKNRTRLMPSGKIIIKLTKKNIKSRKHWVEKQKKLLDEDIVDYPYVENSMNTWLGYALKHKESYNTINDFEKYYNEIFGEEIMLQKEISKDLKRNNQLHIEEIKMLERIGNAINESYIRENSKLNTVIKSIQRYKEVSR